MTRRLPAELETVLSSLVDSYEKVEVASQLTKTAVPMSDLELQQRTQLDVHAYREAVDALAQSRVVVRNGNGSIALGPSAKAEAFQALMHLYSEDRIVVIEALMALSIHRIRSMAAHTFAEAFVLKKKKH